MPIFIKKEETVRLARLLKERTGKPMARIVHEALEEKLQRQEQTEEDPKALLARLRAISSRVAALPILDTRSDDEILGYDENGIPS